jgi:hypothetical protein
MIYLYGYLGLGFGSLIFILAADWVLKKSDSALVNFPKPPKDCALPEYCSFFLLIGFLCLIFWLFWPITTFIWIKRIIADVQKKYSPETPETYKAPEFEVKIWDLLVPMSLSEIEKNEMVLDPMEAAPCLPFGHLNTEWRKFLEKTQASDVFWSFSTKWLGNLIEGYVVVRAEGMGPFLITRSTGNPCQHLETLCCAHSENKKYKSIRGFM